MPEFHAEPYIHLAGLSHKSALVTWGAFYFQTRSRHEWKLVDDRDLRHVHSPRRESIGARSDPYGPARVNVYDAAGALAATSFTETTNFCWISGLTPDTRYRYEVIVKDDQWAEGERWDWTPGATQGLVQRGGRYVNEFRTHTASSGCRSARKGMKMTTDSSRFPALPLHAESCAGVPVHRQSRYGGK